MKVAVPWRLRLREQVVSMGFVLPALSLFAMFSVYPFYLVAKLSVHDWDGISPEAFWVGFGNFLEVLTQDPVWWQSVWHATWITLLALTIQNGIALVLALAVNRDLRGGHFYRVVFYVPPVLSGIVVGLVWNWIYDGNFGILNHALRGLGLGHLARAWLSDPGTALTAVAAVHMWKGFGWGFVILLAGLQSIPPHLYEAAEIDGANAWERFRHITVPMMVPVFFLVSILTILGTMQIFEIIVATTQGGPGYHTEVPVTRIVATMLGQNRFGYACASGLVFGAILLAVSLVQVRVSRQIAFTQ